ncbi:MAG TPA: hypothetical protein VGJ05_00610 [Fimbriiglobus sp.]
MAHPHLAPSDESGEPGWTVPLHGTEVPGESDPAAPPDLSAGSYLNSEDIPSVDFHPRLSRFGEAA